MPLTALADSDFRHVIELPALGTVLHKLRLLPALGKQRNRCVVVKFQEISAE